MTRLIILSTIFLASCALSPIKRVPCPKTTILAEFSKNIVVFQGVPIRTEIDSLSPTCSAEENKTVIDFQLRMSSFRPLKYYQRPFNFDLSYFVVVIDHSGKILSRSDHELNISFAEKKTTSVTHIRLREVVPLQQDVTLYVGFNLDEDQLKLLQAERNKVDLH